MAQRELKGYKGRGVVLHSLKYGENAMIVHLLTDHSGRESFIVQGVAPKAKSSGRGGRGSKAALFQPLFTLEFEGLAPSHGELHKFREVRSAIPLQRTPFDIRRSTISLFIAEVVYRLVGESGRNDALFARVWGAVEALDSIEDRGVANFHLWFLVNLSRELGFMPSGSHSPGWWFDIREGAYTPFQPAGGYGVAPLDAQLLHRLAYCGVEELASIELSRESRVRFLEAMLRYYKYHLDAIGDVRSIEILKELF